MKGLAGVSMLSTCVIQRYLSTKIKPYAESKFVKIRVWQTPGSYR
jgi:hypothetical protein